jgi:hypothetical protein
VTQCSSISLHFLLEIRSKLLQNSLRKAKSISQTLTLKDVLNRSPCQTEKDGNCAMHKLESADKTTLCSKFNDVGYHWTSYKTQSAVSRFRKAEAICVARLPDSSGARRYICTKSFLRSASVRAHERNVKCLNIAIPMRCKPQKCKLQACLFQRRRRERLDVVVS